VSDIVARDGYVRLSPRAAARIAKLLANAFGLANPAVIDLVEELGAAATSAGVMAAGGQNASQPNGASASWTTSGAIAEAAGCSTRTVRRAREAGELLAPPPGAYDADKADEWIEARKRCSKTG
jgi:hypothetical protein